MDTIKPVVLIPVYNNGKTIKSVIIKSLSYINTIIVINDGSTDETTSILKEIASTYNKKIHLIELKKNFGKGFALKAGFKKAYSLGFTHAITLDGDGQHFPEDILNFLEKIKKNPYCFHPNSFFAPGGKGPGLPRYRLSHLSSLFSGHS